MTYPAHTHGTGKSGTARTKCGLPFRDLLSRLTPAERAAWAAARRRSDDAVQAFITAVILPAATVEILRVARGGAAPGGRP